MIHPYIKDAEDRLKKADAAEIKAKHEAESAMRGWAYAEHELGEARAALHHLKQRFPASP